MTIECLAMRVRVCVLSVVLAVVSWPGCASGPSSSPDAGGQADVQRVVVISALPAELDRLLATARIERTVDVAGRTHHVGWLEGHEVVGIIDEGDILMALVHDKANADRPVSDFMTRRLETLTPNASINDLVPIFRADRVAIVKDEANYYGLITKIDLINYLRKQLL